MPEKSTGFQVLESKVIPLPVDNIDTDQIVPARFLKTTSKEGLGDVLFCDWRYTGEVETVDAASSAAERPEFQLNQGRYRGAAVLLAGDNFGCGSSREHAPWALVGWGIRTVISTSFADIFRSNSLKNGLLPVEVGADDHAELVRLAGAGELHVSIDLPAQILVVPGVGDLSFPIDGFSKRCLLDGVDQLGYLISKMDAITAFEREAQ